MTCKYRQKINQERIPKCVFDRGLIEDYELPKLPNRCITFETRCCACYEEEGCASK